MKNNVKPLQKAFLQKLQGGFLGLLLSTSAFGATQMTPHKVQHFTISQTGLTRISIENESIKDMFAYPGSVGNSINLHQSGHLFVAPAGISDPIFLTVIASSGVAQDLKLTFSNKAPRPLILKVKEDKRASKEQVDRWLSVALLGEVPRGFKRESPKHDKRVTEKAVSREIDRFSNGHYDIALCQVVSKSSAPLSLGADLFVDPTEGGRLSKKTLSPYGSTKLALISKKESRNEK